MKNRFFISWTLWTLTGAALMYIAAGQDSENSLLSTIAIVISIAPIFGLLLSLGSPKAAQQFNSWLRTNKNALNYVAGGISLLFALPGLLTATFDPYYTVIFTAIVFAVFGLMKQNQNDKQAWDWTDLTIWIILWIPFDLRWYMDILPAVDSISYTWWALTISVVAIIGWHGFKAIDIGYNLVPKIKDLPITITALAGIMLLVVPPGLLTGFLSLNIPESYDIQKLTLHFIGLFLTVALPEELFFRGILLRGLDKKFKKKWIPLAISSLAFGLMHWNNVSELSTQIIYVSLATVAGIGYAYAYRKSGNNLFAAILTHTLVDWLWKLFLSS